MKNISKFGVLLLIILIVLIYSCEGTVNEPVGNIKNNNEPIPKDLPYLSYPHLYIPIDFERKMCGVTIVDTVIKQQIIPPIVTFKTLSGDSENIHTGIILGTFQDGYTGFTCELPLIMSDSKPIVNNNLLEINKKIDKISLIYKSYNNSNQFNYSITISDSIIYYPQRWLDRLP